MKTTKKKTQKQSVKIPKLEAVYIVDCWQKGADKPGDFLCTDNRGGFFVADANSSTEWEDDPINLPKKAFKKISSLEAIEWACYAAKFADGGCGNFSPVWDEAVRLIKSFKKGDVA